MRYVAPLLQNPFDLVFEISQPKIVRSLVFPERVNFTQTYVAPF